LEIAMGFLLRSAFWLGIVYSAMPFDAASLRPAAMATAPAVVSSLCPLATNALQSCLGAPAAVCGGAPANLCARLQAAAAGLTEERSADAVSAPPKRRRSSNDTLTPGDRVQPWRGPPQRSQG
jgi:hypothetical protein